MRSGFIPFHVLSFGVRRTAGTSRISGARYLSSPRRLRGDACSRKQCALLLAATPTRFVLSRQLRLTCSSASTGAEGRAISPAEGDMHSTSNAELPSLAELKAFIRSRAETGAVRKIVNAMQELSEGVGPYAHVAPDADLYRIAVRSLLRNSRTDLAFQVYELRIAARKERPDKLGSDVGLAASVLKAVIRDGKKRKQVELDATILYRDIRSDCTVEPVAPESASKKAAAVAAVISALLSPDKIKEGRLENANRMVLILKELTAAVGPAAAIPVAEYNDCIRLLGKKRELRSVFNIFDCLRAADVEPNNETFEFLANCVVRQVDFVTGAVSMETLPEPLGAEVAFVGRSNVGKSSLVNMICNRRALAYVSGRPGKTQQFNYFLVNGNDSKSSFYLVDLPGVGYARVSKSIQAEWLQFMNQYLSSRPSLQVVFHLIDGRHGAMADDELLMQRVASSRFAGQYVVVITKMDKLDRQRVKQSTLDKTRATLVRNGCGEDTPILLTSASSRLGRDQMWRCLQRALRL